VSPLVRPPPPVRLRLRLSSHRRLSSRPSRASCPSGFRVASPHAAASRPPAPLPLIAPPLVTAPLSRLLSSWLSRHFSSRRHLPSAYASASHRAPLAPLVQLVVASPIGTPPPPSIVPPPLIAPLSRLLSVWLSRPWSSRLGSERSILDNVSLF
jgi:hypothetical protein